MYSGKLKENILDRLFEAVLELDNVDESSRWPRGLKWRECFRKTGPTAR